MISDNYFHLCVTGQISAAYFPIGMDSKQIFCRYDVVMGKDWEIVSGLRSGITQCASIGTKHDKVCFNFPLEFTFKSTNPHGWPQIVFSLYGNNWWGIETSRGYARIHVPISGSSMEIKAPILIPKCTNIWSALLNWFQNKNPELRDPRLLVNGTKNNGLSTESYGELLITLQSISRGAKNLSLDWGQS